jgi:hypothetical protein
MHLLVFVVVLLLFFFSFSSSVLGRTTTLLMFSSLFFSFLYFENLLVVFVFFFIFFFLLSFRRRVKKLSTLKVCFFCIWKHILAWKIHSSSTDLFTDHMYTPSFIWIKSCLVLYTAEGLLPQTSCNFPPFFFSGISICS